MNIQLYFLQTSHLLANESRRYPALERLLSVSQYTQRTTTLQVMLCEAFAVQKQSDWPLAAINWLGEGGQPDFAYWLQADPAHFVMQRDCFALAELVALPQACSQSLQDSLNQHFAEDGLQFRLGQPDAHGHSHWYLRLNANPEISTTLPEIALGRDVRPFLPQGVSAMQWNRLLNEVQMLLHVHPLNQAREAEGKPMVNSVWLSAGGVLPGTPIAGSGTLVGSHPLVKGISLLAHAPHLDSTKNALELFENSFINNKKEPIFIVLDDIEAIEESWFEPLLVHLHKRKIKQLSLHFSVQDQVGSFSIRPLNLYKFWRKSKLLQEYF
ncbi:MAG: hypothetical protein HOP04_02975 [Methylophilaceae bacterium]|nr:hypothetical protein [Methylophilaceae bacterium]